MEKGYTPQEKLYSYNREEASEAADKLIREHKLNKLEKASESPEDISFEDMKSRFDALKRDEITLMYELHGLNSINYERWWMEISYVYDKFPGHKNLL